MLKTCCKPKLVVNSVWSKNFLVYVTKAALSQVNVNMPFSLQERIFIVERYMKCKSFKECQIAFRKEFGTKKPPDKSSIWRLVKKCENTGNVADQPRSGRKPISQDALMEISQCVQKFPHISLRKLSAETGVSVSVCHKVIRKLGLRPYRLTAVHHQPRPSTENNNEVIGKVERGKESVEEKEEIHSLQQRLVFYEKEVNVERTTADDEAQDGTSSRSIRGVQRKKESEENLKKIVEPFKQSLRLEMKDGFSQSSIKEFEKEMEVKFPKSYKSFLAMYGSLSGHGSGSDFHIYGINKLPVATKWIGQIQHEFHSTLQKYYSRHNTKKWWLIYHEGRKYYFLDTSKMKMDKEKRAKESPVYAIVNNGEPIKISRSFDRFLDDFLREQEQLFETPESSESE